MEFEVKELDVKQRFNGNLEISITTDKTYQKALYELLSEMTSKPLKYTANISKKANKRSLDANARAWTLLGKLAAEMSKESPVSAEELYKNMIPDVSVGTVIPIKNEAVDSWVFNWENRPKSKIGWVSKILGKSKIEGYINTINWYGSSCFDTIEMSKLLKLITYECEQLNIPTESPKEIERLLKMWEQRK